MHVNLTLPDPDDRDLLHETDASRQARQKQLFSQIDADARESRRNAKLDHYFSQHPPNGPTISVYRNALAAFVNSDGVSPRWLTYSQIFASLERLERRHVLKIEMTMDKFNIRHYTSTSTAKRRSVRPAELDTLVRQLKTDLGSTFERFPALPVQPTAHGCQQITIDKWRVRLFFGGKLRALGCYPFNTALRIQDALAFHFSPYRRPAHYNTSEGHAAELLAHYPALSTFCLGLEKHWLDAGVLCRPGVDKTEERWQAIESQVAVLNSEIAALRQLIEKAS